MTIVPFTHDSRVRTYRSLLSIMYSRDANETPPNRPTRMDGRTSSAGRRQFFPYFHMRIGIANSYCAPFGASD